jgi:hypothetical protein
MNYENILKELVLITDGHSAHKTKKLDGWLEKQETY